MSAQSGWPDELSQKLLDVHKGIVLQEAGVQQKLALALTQVKAEMSPSIADYVSHPPEQPGEVVAEIPPINVSTDNPELTLFLYKLSREDFKQKFPDVRSPANGPVYVCSVPQHEDRALGNLLRAILFRQDVRLLGSDRTFSFSADFGMIYICQSIARKLKKLKWAVLSLAATIL